MSGEIDLERGDPDKADAISRAEQRRQARRSSTSSGSAGGGSKSDRSDTAGVENQLRVVLDRLAEQRESREDQELADAIRETRDAIVTGFMSVTRTIAPLRQPLVFVLAVADPILAFWKVGSILTRRWFERRTRKIEEYERAQAMANANTATEWHQAAASQ